MEISLTGRGTLEHAVSLGAELQVRGLVVAPGPGKYKVSQTRAAGIHSIDNREVFGEHFGGSQWLQRLLGSLVVPPGPSAGDQGWQQWWLGPGVCTHLAVGTAAGAYVMAGAGCKYPCGVGGQGRQRGLGSAMASLATTGVPTCGC